MHVRLAPLYDTVPTVLWPRLRTRGSMNVNGRWELSEIAEGSRTREPPAKEDDFPIDELPRAQVKPFEAAFHAFLDERYPDVIHEIEKTKDLPEAAAARLDEAAKACKERFLAAA